MRKRHDIFRGSLLAVGVLLPGCDEYPLHDLGYTTEPSTAEPPEEDPGAPIARHISELAGVWLGEAEDPFALASSAALNPPPYHLPSGSSHIWLRIPPDDETLVTITFGDVDPPAPATNGDIGYPEGAPPVPFAPDASIRPPVEGFPYSMYRVYATRDAEAAGVGVLGAFQALIDGMLIDGKLDLSYIPTEVFGSWCALQTSESCEYTAWGIDDAGLCYGGNDDGPTDCGKVMLCASEVCSCTPGYNCSASINRVASLVLRLSEDGLVGLFLDAVFLNARGFQQPLGTVHFRRVEPSELP